MSKSKLMCRAEKLGFSKNKEQSLFIIVNVSLICLGIAGFLITKIIYIPLIFLFLIGVANYYLVLRYDVKERCIKREINDEFITAISYFQTFIINKNNVYQAFNNLRDYVSPKMHELVDKLLDQIDNDKSVKPFIDFANNFSIGIARNLMLSIYQMVDMGENITQLTHFAILFNQISNEQTQAQKERKEKSFGFPMIFPLLGAGLITVSLTFGILSIMGDLVNVI